LFRPTAAQKFTVGHEIDVNSIFFETVCGEDHRDPL
jgi:hypothetical protein